MAWTAGQAREIRRKYHLGEFAKHASPHKQYLKKVKIKRSVVKMARHKKSSGGFGSKKLVTLPGIIGAAMLGIGAAAVAKRFVGAPLGSFTGAAAGFTVGGLGGAVGGWIHDNIGNVGGSTSGGNFGSVY